MKSILEMNQQVKNYLLITYYWPPSGGSGVQRWLKFVKYLPPENWKPVVYTAKNPEYPSLDHSLGREIPDHAIVIKRKIREPYHFYKLFRGMRKEEKINTGFLSENKPPALREKISVWIRGNCFIPDARRFWIGPSVRFLKKMIRANNIDLVITTGPPHSMHMIGLRLKRITGLPWIADFRDPWTKIDYYDSLKLTRRSDKKHKKYEKQVLENADRVLAVSPSMANDFRQITSCEPVVLTNGYDPDDFATSHNGKINKFSILHLGTMNKDRNHPVFWKVISQMADKNPAFKKQLHLHLIGKVDYSVLEQITHYGLDHYVTREPYVDHKYIMEKLKSAAVLYLPINDTRNAEMTLTGKLFEYLAAERPVVSTGPVHGDAAQILKETGSGSTVDFKDETALEKILMELFSRYQAGKTELRGKGYEKYSRVNLAKNLSQLMEEVVNND